MNAMNALSHITVSDSQLHRLVGALTSAHDAKSQLGVEDKTQWMSVRLSP